MEDGADLAERDRDASIPLYSWRLIERPEVECASARGISHQHDQKFMERPVAGLGSGR